MAAGTRTAPDVTGAATNRRVSLRWIDLTGDLVTTSLDVPVAATAAQIEALGDAMQAASQASLYEIDNTGVWAAVPDKNDAVSGHADSVFDVVTSLIKSAAPRSALDWYIPAPNDTVVLPETDNIDPASTELAAIYTAVLALLPAGFTVVQARFSEHKETNKAVKI